MRHLKTLGVALFALLALGLTATSAFATLPDLSVQLTGGVYPIHLQSFDNGKTKTKLNTTGGSKTENKGILVLLLQSELSALGLFEVLFLNVKDVKTKTACTQTGEKNSEEILAKGTYHLVYPSLSPLTLGIAFLLSPNPKFTCNAGKLKVEVLGCVLAQINDPKSASEDVELATVSLLGNGLGVNNLTKYDNAAGTGTVPCILEAEFGTGFLQAEETVEEEIHLTTLLANQMFSIGPI